MRTESYVVDSATGAVVEGLPSRLLWLLDGDHTAYRGADGEWYVADDFDAECHDARKVYVVTRREIVRGLVRFVAELAREADERISARRSDADRELMTARELIYEFAGHMRSGWSREDKAEWKRLNARLDNALKACGISAEDDQ
jgi:hypothetical protein